MPVEGWITLAILGVASVLFATKKIPFEITALSLPVALFCTRVLRDPHDALSGFGSDAVLTLAALFVIGAGLQESGVTTLIARVLQRIAGGDELKLGVAVMIAACLVSAFMPNAAAVAVLLPAIALLSKRTGVVPSRLYMPLSFAAVLGGNLTLLGATPNLLVAQAGKTEGIVQLKMFDFARVGVPMAIAGVAFMALVGRKMLPVKRPEDRLREALHPEAAVRNYGLTKNLFRMKILPKSKVTGRTIAESGLRSRYALEAVAIVREGRFRSQFLEPRPDVFLVAGDEIFLEGDDEAAWRFAEEETVQFGLASARDVESILGRGLLLAEVSVPPRSAALGKTLRELAFRSKFGLNVISLFRKGEAVSDNVADVALLPGDAFLVSGKAQRVTALARDPDWLVLTDSAVTEDVSHAPLALLWLLVAILPPTFGIAPPTLSALAAALLMVLSGCVGLQAAQRAIDWKVLFLVIGIVPVGLALQQHGVATLASHAVLKATAPYGAAAALAALFLLASAIAMSSTNSTAAVLVAPVALEMARTGGVDPTRALLAVAYGASCAFVLPIHQCNLQVMGPGGYAPRDFVRVGLALTAVVAVVAIGMLAW